MQVSVRLAALPIHLDFHSGRNIFQNIFLFRNIPKRTRPKLHNYTASLQFIQ